MSSPKPNFVDAVTGLEGNQLFGNIYGKIKNQKTVNANCAKKRAFQKIYSPKAQPRQPWIT